MSSIVTYKGRTLTRVEDETKVLNTSGSWMEDNITITDETGTEKYLYQDANGYIQISDTLPDSTATTIFAVIPRARITIDTLVDSNGNYIVDSDGERIISVTRSHWQEDD